MPRHGSRYRGKVGRVLGDEEQTAQFQTSRGRRGSLSRLPDAAVESKIKHFHSAHRSAAAGVKRAEKQAQFERQMYLSQKVVAVLLGNSRRRFMRRMLKLWLVSCGVSKKQTEEVERTKRWQKACDCEATRYYGVCAAHCELTDVEFAMPFDLLHSGERSPRRRWMNSTGFSTFSSTSLPPASPYMQGPLSPTSSGSSAPWRRGSGCCSSRRRSSALAEPVGSLPRLSSAAAIERLSSPQQTGQEIVPSVWQVKHGRGSISSWTTALPSADSNMHNLSQQLLEESASSFGASPPWSALDLRGQPRKLQEASMGLFGDMDEDGVYRIREAKHWGTGRRCVWDATNATIAY
mmetsp:Transcript_47956/g.111899  ORF Transcript_47956/g.111899 Transcript_47956/m.111899 type:complete len:349 (+) Transcript_47956:35-1081(+)